ncbi:hypothetical protein HDV57DRAFT_54504 [Trichoderma longibrachiatum]
MSPEQAPKRIFGFLLRYDLGAGSNRLMPSVRYVRDVSPSMAAGTTAGSTTSSSTALLSICRVQEKLPSGRRRRKRRRGKAFPGSFNEDPLVELFGSVPGTYSRLWPCVRPHAAVRHASTVQRPPPSCVGVLSLSAVFRLSQDKASKQGRIRRRRT